MSNANFAIILYTLREPAKENLPATLKRVREVGFEHVQWSGMPPLPAEEIRAALDEAGLRAIAGHCAMEPFEEDFEANVRHWKTVGAPDIAPGGMMGDCKDSLEAWLRGAKRLDELGAKLRMEGIRLSYHNHAFEFEKFEGDDRCKLDILYGETQPYNLYAELDLGWVHAGGADPAAYLRKYAGRCPVVHAKDLVLADGKPQFKPLGQGALDWPAIFAAGAEAGVDWYVYEQDTCEGDVWDSVAASYEFLKANLT
jgi:sugar phosphate isomerase/epimerase